jgi:hypothetical protein
LPFPASGGTTELNFVFLYHVRGGKTRSIAPGRGRLRCRLPRRLALVTAPRRQDEVIRTMHEQVGKFRVNEGGLAIRGLLVRTWSCRGCSRTRGRSCTGSRALPGHLRQRDGPVLPGLEGEDRREVRGHQPRRTADRDGDGLRLRPAARALAPTAAGPSAPTGSGPASRECDPRRLLPLAGGATLPGRDIVPAR